MKALVTGAAGFIGSTLAERLIGDGAGSTLAERLIGDGATVTGIDCFTDYYPRPIKEGNLARLRQQSRFRLVESAIQDADLDALLEGVTHVFHLAAQAGVRKSWGRDFHIYTANNIDATQRLLEACVRHPVERFVYASSSSVYGDHVPLPMREESRLQPVSPYGVSKLAAEQLCYLYFVNFAVPATSLRYFTVYGPRQRPDMGFHLFLKAAVTGAPIQVFGDGEQTRDFTFVADAVSATAAAGTLGVPGRVYNIGGGSRVTLNHVLELIVKTTGRQIEIARGPAQKGDMRDTYAETTAARADLRFAPSVSLAEGLAAEYAWIKTVYA